MTLNIELNDDSFTCNDDDSLNIYNEDEDQKNVSICTNSHNISSYHLLTHN